MSYLDADVLEDVHDEDVHLFTSDHDASENSRSAQSSSYDRWLASSSSGTAMQLDYSVLAVLVMTLGLIMIVEVARHRLDQAAKSRPFFKSVLKGVYTELTTLGLVELFIWLLHSYYDGLDMAKEMVFAKVHFTLFYTAIFNAFQTVIVAFFSVRVSRNHWVSTETLELNHYVEIREEFQRVQEEVQRLTSNDVDEAATDFDRSFVQDPRILTVDRQELRRRIRRFNRRIRYPRLYRRYNQLLVQIRFHELRVHLLQAYQLPMKMKVSDYLMRCELVVLIKLVHISVVAWLLLTGTANVLYYVLGIVSYEVEDTLVIGTSLEYLFFISMTGFVVIAGVLRQKMLRVFGMMMHKRALWDMSQRDEEKLQLASEQLHLFWLGSPKLVIASIQFMQFGYALALSVVLIFWSVIAAGRIPMRWYILMIAVTYSIFVWVVATVIPEYTLCTCLGQLVDQRRLHETVSFFRLEEAKRHRAEQIALQIETPELFSAVDAVVPEKKRTEAEIPPKSSEFAVLDRYGAFMKVPADKSVSHLLVDFVKLDTKELRSNLAQAEIIRRARRRERKRSVSDGVKLMANLKESMTGDGSIGEGGGDGESRHDNAVMNSPEVRRRTRSSRRKSVSDGVAMMAKVILPDLSHDAVHDSTRIRHPNGSSTPTSRSQTPVPFALVTSETQSLRELLPESERLALEEREAMKRTDSSNRLGHLFASKVLDRLSVARDDLDLPHSKGLYKAHFGITFDSSELLKPDDTAPENLRARRRAMGSRRKSVSDGVHAMVAAPSFAASVLGSDIESKPIPESEVLHSGKSDVRQNVGVKSEARHGLSTPDHVHKSRDDDSQSVRTEASVHGCSSDGSIPDVDPDVLSAREHIPDDRFSLHEWLREYYLSKRFVLLSNVFGTMVAFFFIGQRVESFLTSEGIIDPAYFVTFDFPNNINFWVIFTWYLMFLVTNAVIFWTYGRYTRLASSPERALVVSAWLDIFLTGFCLAIFCVAEAQRCCYSNEPFQERRQMATNNETEASAESHGSPAPCTCPAFGSRSYGGLGSLEPFTSLIALRILRRSCARLIISYSNSKPIATGDSTHDVDSELNPRMELNPFAVFGESERKSHSHMTHELGSIVELWQSAIEKYPEIVARHGEFSGQLLQAMLGVPMVEADSTQPSLAFHPSDTGAPISTHQSRRTLSLDQQYSRLTPRAQEVIMAGKLGRSVKSTMNLAILDEGGSWRGGSDRSPTKLRFEIDLEQANATDLDHAVFSAPNARLIRSMRRGDRKLLPLLQKWSVVDVVVTRFEMIYFDATDVDSVAADQRFDTTKEAIVATKGGKGLRLCDVAVGRRVVGHLDISDIESVFVEREPPSGQSVSEESQAIDVPKIEYWQSRTVTKEFNRSENWRKTNQDVLKIQTKSGRTLYVRFYSDLADSEAHPERVSAENAAGHSDIFKNNAFQWAMTLIRLCGPDQLKQNLPHFGNDTSDELRDVLQLKKASSHRRHASSEIPNWHIVFSQRNLVPNAPAPASTPPLRPPLLRRASTTMAVTRRRSHKPPLHRSSSVDGDFAGDFSQSGNHKPPLHRSISVSGDFARDNSQSGSKSTYQSNGGGLTANAQVTDSGASAMSSLGNGSGSAAPTNSLP